MEHHADECAPDTGQDRLNVRQCITLRVKDANPVAGWGMRTHKRFLTGDHQIKGTNPTAR